MKRRKKNKHFGDMNDFAIGTAKTGVTFGAAGAVASMSPVSVTGGLSTAASFMPMMGTMAGAGSVLKSVKKLNKKRR